MALLRRRILEFLQAQHPASARNVFYRLVQDGQIDKTEAAYKNIVKLLVSMRRSSELPYSWLSDATRRGYHVAAFRDEAELLETSVPYYRWDMWAGVATRVEIWCESAALYPVLQPVHGELAVSLFACRGYSSIAFAYEAAMHSRQIGPAELVIVYVGDYDADGREIDRALIRELRRHVDGAFPVTERRVAVNVEQIKKFRLPTRPDRTGAETVQAEALEPALLRRLVREAVVEYLPEGRLERAELETEAGRATIRKRPATLQAQAERAADRDRPQHRNVRRGEGVGLPGHPGVLGAAGGESGELRGRVHRGGRALHCRASRQPRGRREPGAAAA